MLEDIFSKNSMIFMNFSLKIIFTTSYESMSSFSDTTKRELYLEIKEIIFESNFVSYVSVCENRIGFEKNRVSSVT